MYYVLNIKINNNSMKTLADVLLLISIMFLCAIYDGSTIINIALVCTVVPFTIRMIARSIEQEKQYDKKDKKDKLSEL